MTAHVATGQPGLAVAVLRSLRPRQWVKNLLVVAAPLAAGALGDPAVLGATIVAVLAFCLASSAVYLANDCADREADRRHPVKQHRPIAAGQVSVPLALVLSAVLAVGALVLAATTGWPLVGLMAGYLVLQASYSAGLKNLAVLDIAAVALGFLLRAVAGGLASELPISQWFLLVAGFGSLSVVLGKRYSELRALGSTLATRPALGRYTESYLRSMWGVATGVTILSYCLWAFEKPEVDGIPWHAVSIVPFVVGLMRYALDVDAGRAAEPEDILWRDRVLQAIGVAWLVCVSIAVSGS